MAPLGPTLLAFALVGVLVATPGPKLAVSASKPPALAWVVRVDPATGSVTRLPG
jgi:hypothetical protein